MIVSFFHNKNRCLTTISALWVAATASLAKDAHAESPLPKAVIAWSFPFASNFPYNDSSSTPTIAPDGTIYVGSFDGTFYAVTPAGREKWRFKAGHEIKSSPAIADDGTIYFGSRDRKFYALNPDGKLKWSFATGAWVDSSPAIAVDGTIYFGGWDKKFYALHPDGSVKWKWGVGAIVNSSPAIAVDGTIYFGAHDKKFYALNPDGKVRWVFATDGPIISSPAIGTNGNIYFSSTDGNLYSLRPDGTEQWHYRTGGITESSPVLDEADNLYLGVNQNVVQTFSRDGKFRWSWSSPILMNESVAVATGRIYASMPWRMLYALQSDNKKPLWQQGDFKSNLSASPMIGTDGTVYAVCNAFLHAIHPPNEALPPAKSPWPMFRANIQHTGRINASKNIPESGTK